jgi:ABC-type Fe3+-hydroxamate transport system substrate-binding protein
MSSQIASTVPIDDEDSSWRKEIRAKVSEALGGAAKGESVMDGYYARVDEFKRSMESPLWNRIRAVQEGRAYEAAPTGKREAADRPRDPRRPRKAPARRARITHRKESR